MVGSNRVRHAADLIYGEADINNVTARERDQVPSSKPGPEIWRKHPPPVRSQKAARFPMRGKRADARFGCRHIAFAAKDAAFKQQLILLRK